MARVPASAGRATNSAWSARHHFIQGIGVPAACAASARRAERYDGSVASISPVKARLPATWKWVRSGWAKGK